MGELSYDWELARTTAEAFLGSNLAASTAIGYTIRTMDLVTDIRATFWSPRFWFPPNMTWQVFEHTDTGPYKDFVYPRVSDLLMPFPIGLAFLLLRAFMNAFVYAPIGRYYKLKEGKLIMPENVTTLQKFYKKTSKRPSHEDVENLAKELQWPIRNIERWFRKRRNLDKSSVMKKFCESCWRQNAYFVLHLLGVYIMYDEDITYNVSLCWENWPYQHLTTEFYWYYVIELGFYWSLLWTAYSDVKRSDYLEHIIHHIVTISLMSFSWVSNFVRVGVWVLCCHDVVDHWLDLAKVFKYIRKQKPFGEWSFLMFTLIWFVTRLFILPFMVYTVWTAVTYWPAYIVHMVFLTTLQVMHIMWSIAIARVVLRALTKDEYEDERSDSDLSTLSEEEMNDNHLTNGMKKIN